MWKKKELAEVDWNRSAWELHNFIRGNDKVFSQNVSIASHSSSMCNATNLEVLDYFETLVFAAGLCILFCLINMLLFLVCVCACLH